MPQVYAFHIRVLSLNLLGPSPTSQWTIEQTGNSKSDHWAERGVTQQRESIRTISQVDQSCYFPIDVTQSHPAHPAELCFS